jgi:hypothetical protein
MGVKKVRQNVAQEAAVLPALEQSKESHPSERDSDHSGSLGIPSRLSAEQNGLKGLLDGPEMQTDHSEEPDAAHFRSRSGDKEGMENLSVDTSGGVGIAIQEQDGKITVAGVKKDSRFYS